MHVYVTALNHDRLAGAGGNIEDDVRLEPYMYVCCPFCVSS